MPISEITLKHVLVFTFFCLLFNGVLFPDVRAQTGYKYNYNVNNGLPNNRVYGILMDKHGYLWIATEKGVVKYNGYDFKPFNLSNGLPTEDIWYLFEDKAGKIWLGNSTSEMGYIYNDNYNKAVLKGADRATYPKDIRAFGDGIIFYSHYIGGKIVPTFCIGNGDTIYTNTIYKDDLNKSIGQISSNAELKNYGLFAAITFSGQPYLIHKMFVFKAGPKFNGKDLQMLFKIDSAFYAKWLISGANMTTAIGDYLLSYLFEGNTPRFYGINLKTGQTGKFSIRDIAKGEPVDYITYDQSTMKPYIITPRYILEISCKDSIEFKGKYRIRDMVGAYDADGLKIRAIQRNRFWGTVLGTTTNGVIISYDEKDNFKSLLYPDLKNYNLVGNMQDSISFWWNGVTKTLLAITTNEVKTYKLNNISGIASMISYGKDTFLINSFHCYYFNYKTGKLTDANKRIFDHPNKATIIEYPGTYFTISGTGLLRADVRKDTIEGSTIDIDKYNDITYDSVRNRVLAYNLNRLFIHDNTHDTILSRGYFPNFGIDKIECITIDNKYGNVFFKGTNNITIYDPEKNKAFELFKNLNLKEAFIYTYHGKLIVAGPFGVAFCKIFGLGQISEPLLYRNIKNTKYNYIYCCNAFKGKLIMNTDKGIYQVIIPSDSEIIHHTPDSTLLTARYVYKYMDTLHNFVSLDTVVFSQSEKRIQFDVINPYGNGHISYSYRFANDAAWHELNANELNIPNNFEPGKYYTMYLMVHDNVWRSNPITLNVYIQPYWYQTKIGKRTLWGLISFFILLVLATAVFVTRKLVLNASKKRTMRLELELKAIYAQINPHFIFNTLNSALLLVNKSKMEEAYTHISRFSRLLRSYIKSSRNKLITIAEEIVNLSDYIELQQTRFKNKFEYELLVEDKIRPEQIMIPSLLIQPFVENAINHGILPKTDKGHLSIKFGVETARNEIVCTIEDDGIGRKQSRIVNESKEHKEASYGDLLIKDLVSIFNKYENMNIEISYKDKEEPLTGTIVTILIKNPHYAE